MPSDINPNSPMKPAGIRIAGACPRRGRLDGVEIAAESSGNTGTSDADRLRILQKPQ
jgi:hypothetical protein